ncbi:hypothetical protein A0H81_03654 [Grifola frondosa]|uniref:DUF4218 domain-containing protein n=1 Tax=Grifola frondosa TaxID=5627 RepID=A0A1C7MJJ8_GRIFR|nr:hypothetical protein A0H81_03654 [Grifola frondosa]
MPLQQCQKAVLWHMCEDRNLRRAGTVKQMAKELMKWAFAAFREVRSMMEVPSWINPVPRGFGTSAHGKLSADQWRTACTIYLPVALILAWGGEKGRQWSMLSNFMDLVTAVVVASSRSISSEQIKVYEDYMLHYLQGLKVLYKESAIVANHHLALHLGQFLRHFGPVHAWRSFAFERFNYMLQKINTNLTFGKSLKPH